MQRPALPHAHTEAPRGRRQRQAGRSSPLHGRDLSHIRIAVSWGPWDPVLPPPHVERGTWSGSASPLGPASLPSPLRRSCPAPRTHRASHGCTSTATRVWSDHWIVSKSSPAPRIPPPDREQAPWRACLEMPSSGHSRHQLSSGRSGEGWGERDHREHSVPHLLLLRVNVPAEGATRRGATTVAGRWRGGAVSVGPWRTCRSLLEAEDPENKKPREEWQGNAPRPGWAPCGRPNKPQQT